VKRTIAIKVIKSKRARRVALKAMKNPRIRKIVVDQARRRVLGK
jgi:hypothetical protein